MKSILAGPPGARRRARLLTAVPDSCFAVAVGQLLFNVVAMVAESDLILLRTVEGMKVAKAKDRLRGKQPKPNRKQEPLLVLLCKAGECSTLEVVELFGGGRSTVYRAIERQCIAAKADIAEAASASR